MSTSPGNKESFASLFEQSAGAKRGQRRWHTGETVEVTIVVVGREAVFADLGGKQEGYFERIELTDPEGKLRVEVGSKISAVVAGIDETTGQVRLSPMVIRSTEVDAPVARATTSSAAGVAGPVLVEGSRVKGKVTGIERYGLFVQIAGTSGRSGRGLVPTQESATPRGSDLKKHFSVGQEIEAKILAVDETGKIRLSIGALSADDERGLFEAFKSGQTKPDEAAPEAKGARPAPKGKPEPKNFGTLGDLLPKLTPKPAAKPVVKEPARKAEVRPAASAAKARR